ncbi:uncharacterized protein ACA1_053410 [Acanthamoeba castellanii str. Neff]|uniref:Uncharacterized protein n=1 Tax=Acanthamoeba castellanii (strain ATCC 30010 / Neff) TaxID=1257118 RepID=L8H7E0_ACACF|nr:uncharacterized protein ACA1_053410 [Acanthamoeba castellanii str. Neff]ELR20618.1 hypothetical protein ACA1_053410 [Acanthamoeba castellanii str. Neff]
MEEEVRQHLVVVVGASRGLGRALALELVRDLDAPSGSVEPQRQEDRPPVRPHVRVVLAARDAAGLASTAAAINKQHGQLHQLQHPGVAPRVLEVDLGAASEDASGREGAVAAVTAAVQAGVAEAQERGHAWRVVVVYAAGAHEPASVRDDDAEGAPCWRYSRADDWSSEEVARWWRVNVGSAVALLSRLQGGLGLAGQGSPQPQQQGRLVFVYLSSQAAEERWWPQGNALYGPQKREAEVQLASTASATDTTLLCVRYPFVATEMADKLFAELLPVDAGLHADPTDITSPPLAREQVFLPLAKAAADTAALISAQPSKAGALHAPFRLVEPQVFSYEPARQ